MTGRVGFCCKWIDHPDECAGRKPTSESRDLNGRSTTMRWLREHPAEAEQRQWDIMNHNAAAALRMVERVGSLAPHLRMVRLGSEMLQGYTEPAWKAWWQRPEIQAHCEKIFAPVGQRARELDVRLSFHPGQFCCIVSENPDIVERSLEELEYHADMVRWMGYGLSKLDFKINVHLSGRLGPSGFDAAWNRMSPELRNCLTLENDEYQIGLDDLLPLRHRVGIVLDVHHHLIKTHEYISADDDRIKQVIESWQGRRPVIHYSQSPESYLADHDPDQMIDIDALLSQGHKKAKLRAHSDFMWNRAVNQWALQHWEWSDVQVEAKGKNLASRDLLNQWQGSI